MLNWSKFHSTYNESSLILKEEYETGNEKYGILIDFRPDFNSLIPRRIKKQLRINCTYGRSEKLSVTWI